MGTAQTPLTISPMNRQAGVTKTEWLVIALIVAIGGGGATNGAGFTFLKKK